MARNDDNPVTWRQVAVSIGILVAFGGSILKMTDVAGESKQAIINVEKAQEAQHKIHNDSKFAHEPMRQMFRDELNDAMNAQTLILTEEIRKIGKKN